MATAPAIPEKKFIARRPIGYDGTQLDRGQVFVLTGARNDEKLVRLGYIGPLSKRDETYACGECGAEFIGIAERNAHGDERHRTRELTPYEEDQRLERQERLLETVAPLHLDKTLASQK